MLQEGMNKNYRYPLLGVCAFAPTPHFISVCLSPVLYKTSKGMRDMNYQNTTQFERAKMLKLPIQPLLVLCGVSKSGFISKFVNN